MAENRMELFIETLTGTAFELSCSPLETICSIKAKIQYSEGIPVSQQHLIWQSQELSDDLCLQDYSINDGATLKLVLGMRVGPINTRQVPDTKKLKDLAEYVERSSESSGSGGRPLTVLVFYDGDKVHMYTLMEKGECSSSPLSGTISETSSIASIKNLEDFDDELNRENEITKEKITHIQERLKAINISKNTRSNIRVRPPQPSSDSRSNKRDFFLPPIHQKDAAIAQSEGRVIPQKPKNNIRKISLIPSLVESECPSDEEDLQSEYHPLQESTSASKQQSATPPSALNYIANSISTYLLSSSSSSSSNNASQTCSSFLPCIPTAHTTEASDTRRRPLPRISSQGTQLVAIDLGTSSVLDSKRTRVTDSKLIKHDPSRMKNVTSDRLPLTSGQLGSSRKFVDLDVWLESRPKTSPEKLVCRNKETRLGPSEKSSSERSKRLLKTGAVVPLNGSEERWTAERDVIADIPSTAFAGSRSMDTETTFNDKMLKSFVPENIEAQKKQTVLSKSRPPDDAIRTKKLRPKKRCSLCSKKTGLATSFICRCGKNFCASHRYAETHHCTYDYKGEGRRLLQLNNPVVAAPKLPKI